MEPLTEVRSGYGIPRLSPDGQRLAVEIEENVDSDIWVYDLNRGTRIRVTAQGLSRQPVWTPPPPLHRRGWQRSDSFPTHLRYNRRGSRSDS